MIGFLDCSGCGCLFRADERACPFCDSRRRRADLPALLLGCMLGLSSFGCGETPDDNGEEYLSVGVTYAAPPPSQGYWGTTTDSVSDTSTETSSSSTSSGTTTDSSGAPEPSSSESGTTETGTTGDTESNTTGASESATTGDSESDTDTTGDTGSSSTGD